MRAPRGGCLARTLRRGCLVRTPRGGCSAWMLRGVPLFGCEEESGGRKLRHGESL